MIDFLKWAVAFLGHLAIWCVVFNHVHATAFSRRARKLTEKIVILTVLLPTLLVLVLMIAKATFSFDTVSGSHPAIWFYGHVSLLTGGFFALRWAFRKLTMRLPPHVVEKSSELIDVQAMVDAPILCGKGPTMLGRVPGNQATSIQLERMTFQIPNCPPSLDGLKICHLSDVHLTGQLRAEYFEKIVELANQFEPDLVVFTGDFCDELECLDWIIPVFGALNAKHGKFYILGNHDKRIHDEELLRGTIAKAGFTSVVGEWVSTSINGAEIVMTGNEMPWYTDVNRLQPLKRDPNAMPLKILLSHSPDQIDWAKDVGFDLMFAGHTHGGQISLPLIGPVVAPSKYGVKYASGTFFISNILLHVSRGISGDEPIRINAPPELGLFTLRAIA